MMQDAVLRVTIVLVLVVAVILAMAWLARRAGFIPRQDASSLRMVSRLSLGPRQHVAVIQVQDTWLVLGLTPTSITALHTLPAQAAPAAPEPATGEAFAQTLAAKLGKVLKRP
ncbi:MAG TPA: flagellar biosynthetic protein FliO [Bordetella sp.]